VIVRELAPDVSVGFRDMEPGDRKFILSSWLRNHRKAGDWPRRMANLLGEQAYYDAHTPVVERLLERSKVVVACNPEPGQEWQVIGYIVFCQGFLHWVFVKKPFRWDIESTSNPRLGSALIGQAFPNPMASIRCSHWTKSVVGAVAKSWRLKYEPFLLEMEGITG
jgi:hypothetical protein